MTSSAPSSPPRPLQGRRIVLGDDHALFRAGVRTLLEGAGAVVDEASDGREGVRLALEHRPDIVLLDVGMPGMNGVEAVRRIRRASPGLPTLLLSMHSDPEYVREGLRAGARGYVLKDASWDSLLVAIGTVLDGRIYIGPALGQGALEAIGDRADAPSKQNALELLTPREREVLQLLAEGSSNARVANRLGVSVRTAEGHRLRVMKKLGLRTVAELTRFAIRTGLSPLLLQPRKSS